MNKRELMDAYYRMLLARSFETRVAEQYTKGRVTTLGDAAHPMTPFLGQGACVAIEDAMVLGRAFAAARTFGEAFCITKIQERNALTVSSSPRASKLMRFRA